MKTVIIGGGVAGLTAGIYGQLSGLDCLIIEKNNFTGGNLTGWERKGFTIDNCMHWLNGTKPGTELNNSWRTVGMLSDDVELIKLPAFYSVERKGERLSLYRDLDKTLDEMCRVSPDDIAESKKFIETVRRAGNTDKKGIAEKISFFTAVPSLVRYSRITLGELATKFKHPLIRCLITDYLSPELSAMSLIFAYSAFVCGNADIPAGGSKAAAQRMEKRYLALGGKLLTGLEAEEIIVEGGRAVGVRLKDGRTVRTERIIACCDPSFTFGKLVSGSYMPSKLRRAYKDSEHTPVFSAIHAAFSCDLTNEVPENPVIFDIKKLNIEGREVGRMLLKPYTSKDCDIPDGKAVLQVMFYLYGDEAARWIRLYGNREKYEKLKAKFAEAVRVRIIKHYPSIKRSLKLLDSWTPATYKRYFNAKNGAFLSFAMKPGRAMILRVPPKVKGIDNLYIATQWQKTPGGLPVALMNAKRTIKEISKRAAKENHIASVRLDPVPAKR